MDKNLEAVRRAQVERTIKALAQNRIPAVYAPTREKAVEAVRGMLSPGEVVTCGGSMTLAECGVQDLLKSGAYEFLDRTVMDPQELYNVDGNGNRVAALIYGPQRVIVVAGVNKIVRNLEEAISRVKYVAAPANGVRLGTNTPCSHTGRCAQCEGGMTAGCASEKRMCCQYVVTGYQRTDRIRVVLVGEELGY